MINENSSDDQILYELRTGKGIIIISFNNLELKLDCGKYKSSYLLRIRTMLSNEKVKERFSHLINLQLNLEHLESEDKYFSEIKNQINYLNENGLEISFGMPISMPDKTKRLQIRIGSVPFFTFSNEFGLRKKFIEKMKSEINFTSPKFKSDSISWKPNFIFKSKEQEQIENYDCGFINLRSYPDSFYNVSSSLATVLFEEPDAYTKNETKELKNFADHLSITVTNNSLNDLKYSYSKLIDSSIRPHEVHKNFGEIYASLFYSFNNSTENIYIPVHGQTPFYDFLAIIDKNDKAIIVKEIPIKDKERGAPCAFTSLLSGLIFKESDDKEIIEDFIKYVPSTAHLTWKLKKSKDKKIKEIFSKILKKSNLAIFITEEMVNYDLIKPIFKDVEIARQFWEYLIDKIDIELTKNKILIGKVSKEGDVMFTKFDPRTVTITSPKKTGENVTAIITNKNIKL